MYDKIVDGKIYILISEQCCKFYIGSTTVSLEERLKRHIESYEEWLTSNFEKGYLSSFEILKYGDYRIELVEDCPQIIGWDLLKRERYHILLNYKNLVNIIIPGKGATKLVKPSETKDVYTCTCGSNMTNRYKVRKIHSFSNQHRQKIREIHLRMISDNPDFEVIEIEEPVELVYETEGITLNILY